ncbi:AraC family transcriptional regulator [Paenibacillus silvisoli]|uniref:AraC family transcriptional regulator n=1 Tax=Paenibacillus silvisoli TaxID=3110539 RepID=UPI00280469E1|nr:AraC family transcriptional regulator [Paenibacillus silvisoli]
MASPQVKGSLIVHGSGWIMGPHAHPSFEVSVVLEGRGSFSCGGNEYPLAAGNVVLIPSGLTHDYASITDIRFGVIEASRMPESTRSLFHRLAPQDEPRLLMLSPMALEQYETLYRQWLRMISQPLQDETRCYTTWMDLLLLFLLQHQSSGGLSLSVAASADFIRSSVSTEISISELAKRCGLSESAYRAAFKEAYGVSPKQYQQQCRIEEAKWLLRSTGRSIQLIGEQVGFTTIHSFSSWFQKKEGASPTDWRKQQQGL